MQEITVTDSSCLNIGPLQLMLAEVWKSVITTSIFFTSYFDIVDRYDFYMQNEKRVIINPVAAVHEFDSRGMQPIHYAVEVGNFWATMSLIEKFGANIDERTRNVGEVKDPIGTPPHCTPLMIAILKNK